MFGVREFTRTLAQVIHTERGLAMEFKESLKLKLRDTIQIVRHGLEDYSCRAKTGLDNFTLKLHRLEHQLAKNADRQSTKNLKGK